MRLTPCYTIIFTLVVHVHISFQQDEVQPCNNEVLNDIINLEDRIVEKLSYFLEDRMFRLLEDKISDLLENQVAKLLVNKLSYHEDKMSELVNGMLSKIEDRISDLEEKIPELLDDKLSNILPEIQGNNNTSGRLQVTTTEEVVVTEGYQCVAVNETIGVGCLEAEGFFKLPEGGQCLKFFRDERRTWEQAEAKCQCHGLALAKPDDAPALRKYIVEKIGSYLGYYSGMWIGGRGGGDTMVWVKDEEVLSNSSSLWRPSHPGDRITSDWCLLLLTETDWLRHYSSSPYATYACTEDRLFTLCEVVME